MQDCNILRRTLLSGENSPYGNIIIIIKDEHGWIYMLLSAKIHFNKGSNSLYESAYIEIS